MYSHIYIEKNAANSETAEIVRKTYKNAQIIYIEHYKDIFNRPHQSFEIQKKAPSLVIATHQDNPIYKGSPLCQSFGNMNFYYTSNILNCPFDCDYCYLQGMYQSGNIVIFSDINFIFEKVKELLVEPTYLCVSYDTDLLAFENKFGFVKKWIEYTRKNSNLKIEVRTKCGNFNINSQPCENVIFAWTLSPENVVSSFEHKTGTLKARIQAVKKALKSGFSVRLCFDPLLYTKTFEYDYKNLIEYVFSEISPKSIIDISTGVFRISSQYMKTMRKQRTNPITYYPFVCENGSYHYGTEKNNYMTNFIKEQLLKYIPNEKIFIWK